MLQTFESKHGELRTDWMTCVDSKLRAIRNKLSIDLSRGATHTDQPLTIVQSIQSRLDVEQQTPTLSYNGTTVNSKRKSIRSQMQST